MFARLLAALALGLLLLGCSAVADRVGDEPAAAPAASAAGDLQQALGEGVDLPEVLPTLPAAQPRGACRQRMPAITVAAGPSPDPRALHRPPDGACALA